MVLKEKLVVAQGMMIALSRRMVVFLSVIFIFGLLILDRLKKSPLTLDVQPIDESSKFYQNGTMIIEDNETQGIGENIHGEIMNYQIPRIIEENVTQGIKEDENKEIKNEQITSKKGFMEEREEIYKTRIAIIRQGCEYYKVNEPDKYRSIKMEAQKYRDFYSTILEKHKFFWADVPKVGSSTMRTLLRKAKRHILKDEEIRRSFRNNSTFLKEYWNQKAKEGYITATFVRHPFSRVLSAYRSKLENESSDGYFKFKGLSEKIAMQFRSPELKQTMNWTSCTFSEFVQAVINKVHNRHWELLTKLTFPCELNYTFIGKMETFEQDKLYLFKKANLYTYTNTESVWKKNRGTENVYKMYFSTLSKKFLIDLYHHYEIDFKLFDYDFTEFLQYIQE